MKKMLLASAFALFGTFAMANEKMESQSELKSETVVEVFGCYVTITTFTYNSCGVRIGKSEIKYYSESTECDGINSILVINKTDAPC